MTDLLFVAAKELRVTHKELAYAMGYDEAYLSRIKSGEKTLPTPRLRRVPLHVRRVLWTLAAQDDGLIVAVEDERRRAMSRLLVALGEAILVLDDRPRRGRIVKADIG